MVELNYLEQVPLGGFNYDNCIRNTALEANVKTKNQLSYTKTGTTICGVVFNVSIALDPGHPSVHPATSPAFSPVK